MFNVPATIGFGIAGWSYPDWIGIVYPRQLHDQLRFIADYVDVIEINSTFYRYPLARTAESWVKRTADHPDLYFTAKLHQDITHNHKLDSAVAKEFSQGLQPMAISGKLHHLLAQFRYDFVDTSDNRDYIERISSSFRALSHLTLELRHNSWQAPDALAFLESLDVTVANLDYPVAHNSFNLRECYIGSQRYLRLHGRNRKAWFDRNAGRDETYNYSYSPAELQDISKRATKLTESAQSLTIIANNHFQGKALANILQLKSFMTGRLIEVPPELLNTYPQLREIALSA